MGGWVGGWVGVCVCGLCFPVVCFVAGFACILVHFSFCCVCVLHMFLNSLFVLTAFVSL